MQPQPGQTGLPSVAGQRRRRNTFSTPRSDMRMILAALSERAAADRRKCCAITPARREPIRPPSWHHPAHAIGALPRAGASGGQAAAADEIREVGDDWTAAYTKSGAKVIPESDSELPAGLGQPEKGVTAVAANLAMRSAADFALGHLASDVVFRAVGVQRDLRAVEHHQQFGLVG